MSLPNRRNRIDIPNMIKARPMTARNKDSYAIDSAPKIMNKRPTTGSISNESPLHFQHSRYKTDLRPADTTKQVVTQIERFRSKEQMGFRPKRSLL